MRLYFTSEEAARDRVKKEPPPELQAVMKEMDSLSVGAPRYYDLREPWLDAPS